MQIATVGPASSSIEMLEALFLAGVVWRRRRGLEGQEICRKGERRAEREKEEDGEKGRK